MSVVDPELKAANDAAYAAAVVADDAWQAELYRVYSGAAGNARYDARGTATPELARLAAAKLAADRARQTASDRLLFARL